MACSFKLSFFGIISEIITLLVSVLHWWANPSMSSAIFTWSLLVFKSLVSQSITTVSGFCLILRMTDYFMSSVFAPGKCPTTNLFSLSDISEPFISAIIESPTRTVTFLYCYWIFGFLSVNKFWSCIYSCRVYQIFHFFQLSNWLWEFNLMICLLTDNQIY